MPTLLALLLVTLAAPVASAGERGAPTPVDGPLCRLDGAIVFPRAELDAALLELSTRPHGGTRLVPTRLPDGRTAVKLFGFREGSIPSELGLRVGDAVVAVDGRELRGPEELLSIWEQLRDAAELHVTISRRGEEVRLWLVFP